MLGHVAENSKWLGSMICPLKLRPSRIVIQHTNAILDDPSLQADNLKNSLGGGDEQ